MTTMKVKDQWIRKFKAKISNKSKLRQGNNNPYKIGKKNYTTVIQNCKIHTQHKNLIFFLYIY